MKTLVLTAPIFLTATFHSTKQSADATAPRNSRFSIFSISKTDLSVPTPFQNSSGMIIKRRPYRNDLLVDCISGYPKELIFLEITAYIPHTAAARSDSISPKSPDDETSKDPKLIIVIPISADANPRKKYFDFLSSRADGSPFSTETLMIYALKLQLMERAAAFSQEKGQAEFDRLYKEIETDIFR